MTDRAFDKTREHNLIKLAQKGKATSLEIFTADFGHWPPHGLEIVNPPTQSVKFRPGMVAMATTPRHWPSLIDPQSIALLWVLTRSATTALALSISTKMLSTLGFVDASQKQDIIHINEALSAYGLLKPRSEFKANIISHEHIHIVQKRDMHESLTSALHDRTSVDDRLTPHKTTKTLKYLANEAELAARLHTTLVNAYQQHATMPLTPAELLRALESQGIDVPAKAFAVLSESVSRVRDRMDSFRTDADFIEHNSDKKAVKEINILAGNTQEEYTVHFWSQTVPRIYGDLLELYGDSHGSARMGHVTHNIQLREIFYKQALHIQNDPANTLGYLERAREMIELMPPDQQQELRALVQLSASYSFRKSPGEMGIIHLDRMTRAHFMELFRDLPARPAPERRHSPRQPPGANDDGDTFSLQA